MQLESFDGKLDSLGLITFIIIVYHAQYRRKIHETQ
jgi:hypothetical protein